MTLRIRIGLIVLSLMLGGVALASPLAARPSSSTISGITIVGGVLSAFIQPPEVATSSGLRFTPAAPELHDPFALIVTDERGRRTGWSVVIGGIDVAGAGSLPFANPAIAAPGIGVRAGNPDLSTQATSDFLPTTREPSLLWTAAHGGGDGAYDVLFEASPAGAQVEPDESIVIVTLTGNAP
jgi:hypothetical protein